MPKHNALVFLATRLAQAQARNAVEIRTAPTIEARRFAEGQRQLLNEVSGWVVAAFGGGAGG